MAKNLNQIFSKRFKNFSLSKTNSLLSKFKASFKFKFPSLPILSSNTLWSIIFILSILVIGLSWTSVWVYFTYIKPPTINKDVITYPAYVEATPVEVGTFETFVTVMGTLKANESIIVKPEIEGKIKEIHFRSGEKVEKGDVLIKLDDTIYKAMEKESVAKVLLYKGKYERALKLYERQAGTLKDKEENFAQLKMAEADYDKAHSQLKKTVIRAPFEGIVGFKDISKGAYVRPGEELVTLDDTDPIKVEFRVGENLIDRLAVDKKVELVVEGFLDNRFEATIEAIDPNVDPIGHSIRVRATLDNKNDLFKPGLFAKVKLLDMSHDGVLMVPEAAIETRGNRESVYVVENGLASNVLVKTGNRNGEHVEILSGLKPGQVVITAGQMRLREKKQPVIILPSHTLKKLM